MMMDYSESMSFEWPPDTTVLDDKGDPIIKCRIPELARAAITQRVIEETIIIRRSEMTPSVLYLGRTKHIELMEIALIIVRQRVPAVFLECERKGFGGERVFCFWHVEGDELAKLL